MRPWLGVLGVSGVPPAGEGAPSCPSALAKAHLQDSPVQQGHGAAGRGHGNDEGSGASLRRKDWELGLFILEKIEGIPSMHVNISNACREDGARLVRDTSGRTRSNGHKVKHKEFSTGHEVKHMEFNLNTLSM